MMEFTNIGPDDFCMGEPVKLAIWRKGLQGPLFEECSDTVVNYAFQYSSRSHNGINPATQSQSEYGIVRERPGTIYVVKDTIWSENVLEWTDPVAY